MKADTRTDASSPTRTVLGQTVILTLGTLILLGWSEVAGAQGATRAATEPSELKIDAPPVTAPPESFFQMISNRLANPRRGRRGARFRRDAEAQQASQEDPEAARERIAKELEIYRAFYHKYVDVNGLPVVANEAVADLALQRTYDIVTHMLAGRPDVARAMVSNGMYLIIIGRNQLYTDMPEYRNARNPAYLNERVRGTGGNPTSFGEENLLTLAIDRYDDESIAVHEFCHTIDGTLRSIDPGWNDRKREVYQHARDKGLWENTYAASNPGEYWAEIAQSYFDCNRVNNWNHGPIGNREQLRAYDPEGFALVDEVFNLQPGHDWRYTFARKQPSVIPPPAKFGVDPYYTKFTWAREFPVIGREADDAALLKANDTIRKVFAYRHDILKALINDDLKLVVLGPDESISNLPEFKRQDVAVRPGMRTSDFYPGPKLLVVTEKNVLGDPNDPQVGDYEVIRVFAKALYQVVGTRPVDPNWDNRGRAVQQYELRVKRLDIEFDKRVQALYSQAMSHGLWKGTAAVEDPDEYWAEGMAAYFDAANGVEKPEGAAQPVCTREALKAYDSGLFDVVDETMAYGGHQDWRFTAWSPSADQVR